MPQIFQPRSNSLARLILIAVALVVIGFGWGLHAVYWSPYSTRVNVPVEQPVPFSHEHHVGGLGIDCRYCHPEVERSSFAGIPPTSTCMNCHTQVLKDSPRLELVRESAATGRPIPWVHIHKAPDYVYFNHSVHVNRGISCVECHGQINKMDEVYHAKPFSMTFCLDCHRNPAAT